MPPTVSVLIPVRDAAGTLDACLRSVARQSATDWECLVVDDGSTDDTPAIAARWTRRDSRCRLLRQGPRGLVAALNHGLCEARGRFVARLDGDDLMHRDRLLFQLRALADDPGLQAVGSHVRFFPRDELGPGMREYERWINGLRSAQDVCREAFVECPVAHPTLTVRTELLRRYPYRDRGWPEDYDLVLRLIRDGHALAVVPRRLVSWRRLPGRLSATSERYAIERFVACKAHHLARSFLRRSERYVLWGYGRTGRTLAAALDRRGRRLAGIVEIHPGRIGNRIQGVDVFPVEDLPRRGRLPLVVSVAGAAPRAEIRAALTRIGFTELVDYVCAA